MGIKTSPQKSESFRSKEGQRFSNHQEEHLHILEQYQNIVSQLNTGKTLKISSSTIHKKYHQESEDISVHIGHSLKSVLDVRDLRAIRRHCIKNRHDSVMETTAWDPEHFQKSLSGNTVHCAIHRCRLYTFII